MKKKVFSRNFNNHIIYKQADITREKLVIHLISKIREEFGELNGIIHSAGVIRDNFIQIKQVRELQEILNPKVSGVVNLDNATQDLNPNFFILFSSLSGAMGNPDQSDYSAANGFMDAYAKYRNSLVALNQRQGLHYQSTGHYGKKGGCRLMK